MGEVHILTGPERRRRWSDAEKRRLVMAAFAPGAVVRDVARRADVSASLIYRWRRELVGSSQGFVPVMVQPDRADPTPMPCGPAAIAVTFGDDGQVSIPATTPPALAAAVLKALVRR